MKRKTVYKLVTTIFVLSLVFYTVVYFFNLEDSVIKTVNLGDVEPSFIDAMYGDFTNPLQKPMDLALIDERLYVTDADSKNIQVFDLSGNLVSTFGEAGLDEGKLAFPYGISGDGQGNVYVADMNNDRIAIFDLKGAFIRYFEEKDSKNPAITSPGGLRVIDNKLYLTDIETHKVLVYDLEGNLLLEIGGPGQDPGYFVAPNAVAVDSAGQIYVSDSGNNRVQIFDKEGQFLKIINGSKDGKGASTFLNPRGVAVDTSGKVYIVSKGSHDIHIFDKDGELLYKVGTYGFGNGQFNLPNGILIDPKNHIYITDTANERVSIYR